SMRPAGAEADGPATDTVDDDTAGPYAWADAAQGRLRARQHLDARHARADIVEGDGGVRRLAPGRSFTLTHHATQPADAPMVCLRVTHLARNNLDADVQSAIEARLGHFGSRGDPNAGRKDPNEAEQSPRTDFYRNTLTALPATRTWR